MRIGRLTNDSSNEWEMQAAFKKWLVEKQQSSRQFNKINFLDEVTNGIGRRADFLLLLNFTTLINVEAKTNPCRVFMDQLDNHATYCDYCFALISDFCLTPKWFKEELIQKGYGLIVYNQDSKVITEVLEAHSNKGIDRKKRHQMIESKFLSKPLNLFTSK